MNSKLLLIGVLSLIFSNHSSSAQAAVGNIISCVPPGPDNYLRVERWDGPEQDPSTMDSLEAEKHWLKVGIYYSQKNSGYVKIDGMLVDTNRFRDGHPYRVTQVISSLFRQAEGGSTKEGRAFLVRPYADNYTRLNCKPACKDLTACIDAEAINHNIFQARENEISTVQTVWTDESKKFLLMLPKDEGSAAISQEPEASWLIDITVPGSYSLTANIPQSNFNYSRHVEYVIEGAAGQQVVPVNQARFRGSWYDFGYFDFQRGLHRVSIRNLKPQTGPMVADSLSLRRTVPLSAPWPVWCNPQTYCHTVDNHHGAFSFNTSEDPSNVALGLGQNKQMVWVRETSDPKQAVVGTWTFEIPQRGDYNISVFIPVWFATSYQVTYTLDTGHEIKTFDLDQSENLGRWVHLGMLKFAAGKRSLSLSTFNPRSRGHYVAFDAIGISANLPAVKHEQRVYDILRQGHCRDCDLVDVDFSNLDIRNIDFRGADLKNATFSGSNLNGSDFSNANLPFAKFVNSELDKVVFANSSLEQADFRSASFSHCRLENLSAYQTIFKAASFLNCRLTGIEANQADFSHSFFRDTIVKDSVFKASNFERAQYLRTDFSKSQIID